MVGVHEYMGIGADSGASVVHRRVLELRSEDEATDGTGKQTSVTATIRKRRRETRANSGTIKKPEAASSDHELVEHDEEKIEDEQNEDERSDGAARSTFSHDRVCEDVERCESEPRVGDAASEAGAKGDAVATRAGRVVRKPRRWSEW